MTPDRTFCIRLKSNPERWKLQAEHLASIGMEVTEVDGFDGPASGLYTRHTYDKDNPGTDYTMPTKGVGMAISHYMIWFAIHMMGLESALILEDDAVFSEDWKARFNQVMSDLPNDWDMLYLGSCCTNGRQRTQIIGEIWDVRYPCCTHAYMVRKTALPVLLDKMQKIWAPIDLALFFEALPLLKVYTVLPTLATQRNTYLTP